MTAQTKIKKPLTNLSKRKQSIKDVAGIAEALATKMPQHDPDTLELRRLVHEHAATMRKAVAVESMTLDDEIIGIKLPIKVDLAVTEAPPSTKGNTAQGGTKQVLLETGASANVPLFINEGDIIKVNTETGDYVERVEKK